MKTLVRLIMLLTVLAICMPAQGEILVYSKLYRCWEAWWDGDWDIDERTQRGFLALDVIYDGREIIGIDEAVQVEYRRDGRNKWYWGYPERYVAERVDTGSEVIWVLEVFEGGIEPDWVWLLMVRGRPRDINIGLGRDERREVARTLNGQIMGLDMGAMVMGIQKEMCPISLRLHNRFTRLANHPDECNQSLECTVLGLIYGWLEDRGYEMP